MIWGGLAVGNSGSFPLLDIWADKAPHSRQVKKKENLKNAERRDVSWRWLNFLVAAVGATLPLSAVEHQGHRSKLPKSTPHNGSCFGFDAPRKLQSIATNSTRRKWEIEKLHSTMRNWLN